MGVIIDLDMTLVDSSGAADARRARDWPRVYGLVPRFRIYDGVQQILTDISAAGTKVCIVTSSPRPYFERVARQFGLPLTPSVCYHDTSLHKPHPAPILRALDLLGVEPACAVSIGDEPRDIEASLAAGTIAVAALWGSADPVGVAAAKPTHACRTPAELRQFLSDWMA